LANKLKETVDYFPLYVKNGRTFYVLKKKYGLKGIGFFTELLRALSQEPGQVFLMRHAFDRERLVDFIGSKEFPITEEELFDFLDTLAETGKIDGDLWFKKRIIASEDYLESLGEAYRRRSTEAPTIESVREDFLTLEELTYDCRQYDDNMPSICRNNVGMVTHKGKERKGKERKGGAAAPQQVEPDIFPDLITPGQTLARTWYKAYHKKTGKLIQPSEKDYQAAVDLLRRTDITTAETLIPHYFSCDQWFMKSKGSEKIVYSFQGFCRHFTELVSLAPQPRGKPSVGTCPDCGTVHLGATTCPRCGKELEYAS